MSGSHLSKEFFDLVKNVGEAKSKQEEDQIISDEVGKLQQHMSNTNISPKKMREYVLRMLYCEMLGHDASFGHIHAVNMTTQTTLLEKRVGYLGVMCTLHADHDFIILLINTIQKDLKSSNWTEVCAALTCVCKLINKETIPAVYPLVINCLSHNSEFVRKKASMAVHRFYQLDPTSVTNLEDHLNRLICDRDPCVMAASLSLLEEVMRTDPSRFRGMVPSLVSIIKQIIEHRLHSSYDYHRTPAPWSQVLLLRCMAAMGQEKSSAEEMYEVLNEVLRRSDTGINIGYAVTYECVRTICRIYPNTQLIEAAGVKIGEFLKSDNHNLRYLGLNTLSMIIQASPKFAAEHQMVVIDCLEDADETLKRKTLALLFKMTNQANVAAVVSKMLHHLKESNDEFLRTDLVSKITQLAERFAPSNEWYIETTNTVLTLAGENCRSEASHNLLLLLGEGAGESEEQDNLLRRFAVRIYVDLCSKPMLGDTLLQVICWVLGEYAYLEESLSLQHVTSLLCDLMETQQQHASTTTLCWILSAVTKLVAQMGECPDEVRAMADKYAMSRDFDLCQRSVQLLALSQDMDTMQYVLPVDASCEDIEVSPTLDFLDEFVQEALDNGADPYISPEERDELSVTQPAESGLKIDAYAAPKDPHALSASIQPLEPTGVPVASTSYPSDTSAAAATATTNTTAPLSSTGLKSAGKKRWNQTGYTADTPTPSYSMPTSVGGGAMSQTTSSSSFMPSAATTQSTYVAKKPAAPAKPPSQEKQKLAGLLFQGLEGSVSAAPPAATQRKGSTNSTASRSRVAVAAPTKPGPSVDNLLNLGDDDDHQQQQHPQQDAQQQQQNDSGPMDLLSLMDDLPLSSQEPGPQQQQQQQQADNQATTNGSSGDSGMDLMGLMGASSAQSGGGLGLDQLFSGSQPLAPTQHLPAATPLVADDQAPTKEENRFAADEFLEVCGTKKAQGNATVVSLSIRNLSSVPLRTVSASFDASSMPSLEMTVAWTGGIAASVVGSKLSLPYLGVHASCSMTVSLAGKGTLPLPLSSVRCQFQYTVGDPGRMVNLHHGLTLAIVDFVTPNKITEQEFGQLWGSHAQERTFSCQHKGLNVAKVVTLFKEASHLAHVSTIKAEVILSGTDVCGRVCLVHVRVSSKKLDIIVRTKDGRFTEALSRFISSSLLVGL